MNGLCQYLISTDIMRNYHIPCPVINKALSDYAVDDK